MSIVPLIQVNDRSTAVQDARYFRSQAELYFELARHMSERQAAESFRLRAAEYLVQADKLDSQKSAASSPAATEES